MSTVQRERGAAKWVALLAIVAMVVLGLNWSRGQPEEAVAERGPLVETGAVSKSVHGERLQLITTSGVHTLDVEVAETPEKQALGLMFRTHLADDKGMLFPHSEPRELSMWMRNTYIPLDMVFIRADGTVHRIEARTEPFSERIISSKGAVSAVLELAGGAAERMGLKPGDKVVHPAFGTAR